MLYHLLYPLREFWFGFNIFRYITFRAAMAAVTAFFLSVLLGPTIINFLKKFKIGQYVRKDEYMGSLISFQVSKEGTPTMGGVLIIFAVLVSTLFWCRLDNDLVILVAGGLLWLGLIGFVDDYLKLRAKNARGLASGVKLAGQAIFALVVGLFVIRNSALGTELYLPFVKNAVMNLGVFYVFFILLVIMGTSNAVNLTDGLDGLAVGCMIFVSVTYAAMSYVTGNYVATDYLNVFYLPGAGELACFCASLVGACLGFLWYNGYPASVFMGDTGSLALGGSIAVVSVLTKKEFLLLIVGGIFVVESLSVMLQVASCKLRKKRIFLMTPIHHHFQLKGWPESKITVRFWIISAILAMLGLASLKVL